MPYTAACPHDAIQKIARDVFMVRGSMRFNPVLRISRNMAVVRHDGELSLVNPIRLDAAGERQLTSLGEVKRLLRIGPMHGLDDAYYVDRFGAELWAPGSSESHPDPPIAELLAPDRPLPFPDAELFLFENAAEAEAALLLRRDPGLLLTCDAIQHYGDYRHNNLPARLLMPWIGFPRTTVLGPIWLDRMTPPGGSLESDFQRLLALDFDRLLAAHGSLLERDAKESVTRAVRKAFPGA